jgi:uncharacterized membrane protein
VKQRICIFSQIETWVQVLLEAVPAMLLTSLSLRPLRYARKAHYVALTMTTLSACA